jgi:hypothetical protein
MQQICFRYDLCAYFTGISWKLSCSLVELKYFWIVVAMVQISLSCYWHSWNIFAAINIIGISLLLLMNWNLLVVLVEMFNLFVVVGMLANLEFLSGAGRFEIFAKSNRAQIFLLLLIELQSLCCCWQNFFFCCY